jgi:hypothetical protein
LLFPASSWKYIIFAICGAKIKEKMVMKFDIFLLPIMLLFYFDIQLAKLG